MKFLSSLDAKDRRLLLWCLGIAITLAVLTGFLLPNGNSNDNPLPSSYLSGSMAPARPMRRCSAPIID